MKNRKIPVFLLTAVLLCPGFGSAQVFAAGPADSAAESSAQEPDRGVLGFLKKRAEDLGTRAGETVAALGTAAEDAAETLEEMFGDVSGEAGRTISEISAALSGLSADAQVKAAGLLTDAKELTEEAAAFASQTAKTLSGSASDALLIISEKGKEIQAVLTEAFAGLEISEEDLDTMREIGTAALKEAFSTGRMGARFVGISDETVGKVSDIAVTVYCLSRECAEGEIGMDECLKEISRMLLADGIPVGAEVVMLFLPGNEVTKRIAKEVTTRAAVYLADQLCGETASAEEAAP